jgi:hypothetical protein
MPGMGSTAGTPTCEITTNLAKRHLSWLSPQHTKNILWYDVDTGRIKIAKHVRFDEGLNDLPIDALLSNVQHVQRIQSGI